MNGLRPFLVALQFLTVLPIRVSAEEAEWRASLAAYPLVGLVVGGLVAGGTWLMSGLPGPLQAALVLGLWVALTGALHLDGLADAADAWLAGLGDRERTLAVMKDPRAGPMAVVTLCLCLLVKYAALQSLLASDAWPGPLLLVPVLARLGVVGLLGTTPYVRAGGLGSALSCPPPRPLGIVSLLLPLIPGLWLSGAILGWSITLVALLTLGGLRRLMCRRIGGTTGDTLGAAVECVEASTLVCAAILLAPAP